MKRIAIIMSTILLPFMAFAARMALPDGVDTALFDRHAIKGRQGLMIRQVVTIGPVKAPIERGWAKRSGKSQAPTVTGILLGSTEKRSETYTEQKLGFRTQIDGVEIVAAMLSESKEQKRETKISRKLSASSSNVEHSYSGIITIAEATYEIRLRSNDLGEEMRGTIQGADLTLDVSAEYLLQGVAFSIGSVVGWTIRSGDRAVAVVDIADDRCYIIKDADPALKSLLYAASVSLTIYNPSSR
jgi:hypothetical protein